MTPARGSRGEGARRSRRAVLPVVAVLAGGALAVGLPAALPAPAYAAGDVCDSVTATDTQPSDRPDASAPVAELRIDQAHDLLRARGREPGEGVVVAVVDDGIVPGFLPRLVAGPRTSAGAALVDGHGTAVAGIIAGPPDGNRTIGFAPAATVVDVRVYDSLTPDEGESGLTSEAVAAGLQALADRQADLGTDIVVVPRPVDRTDALDAAVEALAAADVIVVAASGDRPQEESEPLHDEYGPDEETGASGEAEPGEDAARDAWPAGYDEPTVVAAASTAPEGGDVVASVLQSSAIDVAAPTAGAVGYGMNRAPCVVPDLGTDWAAAEVAGVLALLRSYYPDDSAAQSVTRLYASATGGLDVTPGNVLTGHGVIQPVEALRTPLRPDRGGAVDGSRVRDRDNVPAAVPDPEPDVLAGTRRNAVWWGLFGGGALLVAVVLRPVLARRRG